MESCKCKQTQQTVRHRVARKVLKASRKRKHKAYRALVHIIEEVRQRVSSVFDGTLGFPGEAPPTRGQVSIVGFNANGLRSKDRLSVLLREANFRKVDVLLLQEHKFAKTDSGILIGTARRAGYIAAGGWKSSGSSGGAAVLIRRAWPHIDTTNIVGSSHAMGSIAVAKTRLFGEEVSFTSVYVPVVDARRGYWLRTEESGHISRNAIVHGDWNSVADVALDVKYAEKSSGEYTNSHGSAIAHRGLTDLFRLLNGEARQYTRQGNTVYTRIERMTAPKYNSKWRWRQVQHTNWFPELNSDHMPVCAFFG